MEAVVVTAWRRPDFFHAALTRLALADDGRQQYLLCLDGDHTADVATVAERFVAVMGRASVYTPGRRYPGNSYNTITGYALARQSAADLIHLVEEDVLVAGDYFTAHRDAHLICPDVFAVSMCRNQFLPIGDGPAPDDSAVWLHGGYQSIGVSFRPDRLTEVLRHAVPSYFGNPIGYCRRVFPHTRITPAHAEQDGLLGRVAEQKGWQVAYPAVPRAYHAGFHGAHRNGATLDGSVEQRAEQILTMTADELNTAAHTYQDHTTVDLDADRAPITKLITWP